MEHQELLAKYERLVQQYDRIVRRVILMREAQNRFFRCGRTQSDKIKAMKLEREVDGLIQDVIKLEHPKQKDLF